jgi:hypothetical protein
MIVYGGTCLSMAGKGGASVGWAMARNACGRVAPGDAIEVRKLDSGGRQWWDSNSKE